MSLIGRRATSASARRRLLFVYRFCGLGGVETSILTKIDALRGAGIDASVLFSQFYGEGGRSFLGHPHVTAGLDDPEAVIALLRQGFEAISLVDYPEFLDLIAASGVDSSVVFETHSSLPSSLARFYRRLDDSRIRRIIVPSTYNARLVQERVQSRAEVVVIPNAVDVRAFRPERAWSRWLVPRDDAGTRVLLWVGRLEDEKNPAEFVEIAERLLDRMSGLRFVVVGDAPDDYEGAHGRLVGGMRATTRAAFEFHRTVPYADMPALYRRAGVSGGGLVSTSPYESLPMIVLEAMACRCPVLSTDVGGLRDVVSDGVTGRLYSPGDVAGAVAILLEMLSARGGGTRARMTGRARRQILRRHSPRVVAARYRAMLDAVCDGHGSGADRTPSIGRSSGGGRSV